MVFRVVTLGVVVRKQKISSLNKLQEYGHISAGLHALLCRIRELCLNKYQVRQQRKKFRKKYKFPLCQCCNLNYAYSAIFP